MVELVVAGLAPARTLDIACGTGFLTRHLRGERVPGATLIRGDALELPSAPEHEREEWQERVLNEGDWFVAVSSIGRARAIPAQLSGPERACLRAGS